ncbi:CxxC-x17-CxxC domain-containing protein [Patescibacteria group bacterium]
MRQDNRNNWSGNGRDDRRSSGRNFNKRGFGGGRDSGNRQMHKTICAECGMECEVPFKPSGEKPVYCSNCFDKKGAGRNDRRSGGNRGGNDNKEQLDAINVKLDQILETLKCCAPTKKAVKAVAKKASKPASLADKKVAKTAKPANKPTSLADKKVAKKTAKKK